MASEKFFRLQNGRRVPDVEFDPAFIPTSDVKDALAGTTGSPGAANVYVTDTDPLLLTANQKAALAGIPSFPPTGADPLATKAYVDQEVSSVASGISWVNAVDHNINYVKTDTGAPSGTPDTGDKLLNTFDNTLYEESGGSWDAGTAATSGDRYVWKDTGVGTGVIGGNTTGTADNGIREFNGTGYDITTPEEGDTFCLIDDDRKYTFNGTSWVVLESIQQHNSTSGLQGGNGVDQYFHLTQDESNSLGTDEVLDSSNIVLSESLSARMPVCYEFAYRAGYPASTDSDPQITSATNDVYHMPDAGSIVKVVVQPEGGAPTGTLTAKPRINGVVQTGSLDLVVDSGTTTGSEIASVTPGTSPYTFSAGQPLAYNFVSDGSWSNGSNDIQAYIYVVFDD